MYVQDRCAEVTPVDIRREDGWMKQEAGLCKCKLSADAGKRLFPPMGRNRPKVRLWT